VAAVHVGDAQIQIQIRPGDGSREPGSGDPSAVCDGDARGNCRPHDGDDADCAGRGPG